MVKRRKDFGDCSRAQKYRRVRAGRRALPSSSEDEGNEANNNMQGVPQPQPVLQNLQDDCVGVVENVCCPSPPPANNGCESGQDRDNSSEDHPSDNGSSDAEPPDSDESDISDNGVSSGESASSASASDSDTIDSGDGDDYDDGGGGDDDDDGGGGGDDDDGGGGDDDDGGGGGGGGGGGDDDDDDDGGGGGGGGGDPNDRPLYHDAPITVAESMLSILSLVLSHNLSGSCVEDLLELIEMHCPRDNFCVKTYYKFKKYFADLKSPLTRRYYCSVCFEVIDNINAICPRCAAAAKFDSFVEIPVIPQIRGLFKRPGFYDKIINQQNRRKEVEENYEDIFDGSIHKNLRNPGNLLAAENSFSLTWYSDGVRLFRSSKCEIWPFCLTINELPYRERTKIDNIIIAGLWFGKGKPIVNRYLEFIQNDLRVLRNGVDVVVPNGVGRIRVRGVVMCGTCDLPAKALFLNMKQYNGAYGCQVCKIHTVREHPDRLKRIYPYLLNLELRNDEEHRVLAARAQELNQPRFGVLGRTAISSFVSRPIESTSVDIMHSCWLGLSKFLGQIWFLKENRRHPVSLYQYVGLIDRRLQALRPPEFLQRQPRSIVDHFSYWNASELKAWLMVYSLPLLEDIFSEPVRTHHKLLVYGISILCRNSVSPEMVRLASRLLGEYVNRFQLVYGLTYMSANVHLLLHLPLIVERFGPLWTTSCFPYESMNGVLKKMVSGTRFAEVQIHSVTSMFLHLTAFRGERLQPEGRAYQFCDKLNHCRKKLKLTVVSERMAVVGRMHHVRNLPQYIMNEVAHLPIENGNYFVFHRLFDLQLKIIFSSLAHTRVTKTNSTCVKYYVNGRERFGIVHSYLKITQCDCQAACGCDGTFFAIINQCNVAPAYRVLPFGFLPLIHRSVHVQVDNFTAVPIENLIYVCYLIDVRDRNETFVVEPLNTHEIE